MNFKLVYDYLDFHISRQKSITRQNNILDDYVELSVFVLNSWHWQELDELQDGREKCQAHICQQLWLEGGVTFATQIG